MAAEIDVLALKRNRLRQLYALAQGITPGVAVSDKGRSIDTTAALKGIWDEIRELEREVRAGTPAEVSTPVRSW